MAPKGADSKVTLLRAEAEADKEPNGVQAHKLEEKLIKFEA